MSILKAKQDSESTTSHSPAHGAFFKHSWKIVAAVVLSMVILIAIIAGGLFLTEQAYAHRFYPGSHIGDISVSGLTVEAARTKLNAVVMEFERDGIEINLTSASKTATIRPMVEAIGDPDLSRELFRIDTEPTLASAYAHGRTGNWLVRALSPIVSAVSRPNYGVRFSLEEASVRTVISDNFKEQQNPATNARPIITWNNTTPQITLEPEHAGKVVDIDGIIKTLRHRLATLDRSPIVTAEVIDQPQVTIAETTPLIPELERLLSTSTPKLISGTREWQLPPKQLAPMFAFSKNDGVTMIDLDRTLWQQWAEKTLAPAIAVEAQNAKVELQDGKLVSIQAHHTGTEIDYDTTFATYRTAILEQQSTITIATRAIDPTVTTDTVNDLGIDEIIGTGHSNFKGSPANRRHNITTGAAKLNGVLIAPDEEFSLIKTLGEIDGEHGYLQELVIKGNKTIPEYGGGLCQIGTTTFRATMASGLPILERRNHSYSVTYYLENGLPGVDATIYDPKPDFRFKNDTGHYVLIQTRIQGDDITFEFWGTKDGRKAERTVPNVWGWVSPPPTKMIETTDLPVGQKKCTESAHKGVNASFDYLITYADGREDKQTFTSHYKPWQAVCLVGVAQLSGTASSTDATVTPPATTTVQ